MNREYDGHSFRGWFTSQKVDNIGELDFVVEFSNADDDRFPSPSTEGVRLSDRHVLINSDATRMSNVDFKNDLEKGNFLNFDLPNASNVVNHEIGHTFDLLHPWDVGGSWEEGGEFIGQILSIYNKYQRAKEAVFNGDIIDNPDVEDMLDNLMNSPRNPVLSLSPKFKEGLKNYTDDQFAKIYENIYHRTVEENENSQPDAPSKN